MAFGNKASVMLKSPTSVPNSLHDICLPHFAKVGGILLGGSCAAAQYYFGRADDIFEHKFMKSKKPEDFGRLSWDKAFYGSVLCLAFHGPLHDAWG
jgi:hypothetical protein